MLLGRAGYYDSAAATLERAADVLDNDARIQLFHSIAQMAANRRELDKSVELLERALQTDSTSSSTYGSAIMLLNVLERREQAIEMMETYLSRFPADTAVATELEKYRQGGGFDFKRTFGF